MRKITSLTLLLSILTFTLQIGVATAQKLPRSENGETVLNTATIDLPLSGVTFTESKILDAKGNLTGRAVDKNGRQVSAEKLRAEEERLYREKYGKLQPEAYDAVQKRGGTDNITVTFVLNVPGLPEGNYLKKGDFKMSEKETLAMAERNNKEVDAAVKKAVAPFLDQLAGIKRLPEGFERNRLASPFITVTVTVGELKELVKRNDVLTVFLEERTLVPYLNSSAKTLNVPLLWAYGYTGSGVCVAVVEGDRADLTNTYLSGAVCDRNSSSSMAFGIYKTTSNIHWHPTAVSGIIASAQFTNGGQQHKGIAYGGKVYSASGNYSSGQSLHDAMDAGAVHADISNNSWGYSCPNGLMDSFATHADLLVRNRWGGIIGAAGNTAIAPIGCPPNSNYASATALGYNTIAVGSYYDQKTGFNLMDDQMSSFSSYGNPLFGSPPDIETPELSAPGQNITSTTVGSTGTISGISGTSFASPMVAGVHALVQQINPSLKTYPEITKAILLASSVHNIEGIARASDKDGAGGVDAKVAFDTTVNNRFDWRYLTNSILGTSGYYDVNIGPIPPGQRVKVALDWLSNPLGSPYTSNQLGIDLDMDVYDPLMNHMGGYGSYSDSKEVVQFYTTSTVPGNYKVRVHRYSWNSTANPWTYAAVAWSIS